MVLLFYCMRDDDCHLVSRVLKKWAELRLRVGLASAAAPGQFWL